MVVSSNQMNLLILFMRVSADLPLSMKLVKSYSIGSMPKDAGRAAAGYLAGAKSGRSNCRWEVILQHIAQDSTEGESDNNIHLQSVSSEPQNLIYNRK